MKKFTKFESSIIISCLNNGLSSDLADIQLAEEAGKNPLFTADYIKMLYLDMKVKVDELTKKK